MATGHPPPGILSAAGQPHGDHDLGSRPRGTPAMREQAPQHIVARPRSAGQSRRRQRVGHLGVERLDVAAVANASGAATTIDTYDEYGVPGGGNVGRFQYTGQMWIPEIGLYHYKARDYSPTLGRFLQPDPIGFGGGMNFYGYVGGDPMDNIDPSGLGFFSFLGHAWNSFSSGAGHFFGGGYIKEAGYNKYGEYQGFFDRYPSFKYPRIPQYYSGGGGGGGGHGGAGGGAKGGGGQPPQNIVGSAACALAGAVPGNRIRLGADGVAALGGLLDAGLGVSLEDSGRVEFDGYGGYGAGVGAIGGAGVTVDNGSTPNGASGQYTGAFGQAAVGILGGGIYFHSGNIYDPNMVSASGSVSVGPKYGAVVGFARNATYGKALLDFHCGGK